MNPKSMWPIWKSKMPMPSTWSMVMAAEAVEVMVVQVIEVAMEVPLVEEE